MDLFKPIITAYDEASVASLLGVSRQTLRNWRLGYTNVNGYHPPILTENVHWRKIRKTRKGQVLFEPDWVAKQLEIKRLKEAT